MSGVVVRPTGLDEVTVIIPERYGDARGYFTEAYSRRSFGSALGRDFEFVQDNQSRSGRGVVRGLHYQLPPHEQGKLVRVLCGEIFDVAVDVRRDSPHFGRWVGEKLSAEGGEQMWVPPGFAHGFAVTSEQADVLYKVTSEYVPAAERSIRWDDPAIGIVWPVEEPILSERDRAASLLADAETF